jgi:hypothetical protein
MSKPPDLQAVKRTICANCPRLDRSGQRLECRGPEVPACPLQLWPQITRTRHGTARRGGCRGCG